MLRKVIVFTTLSVTLQAGCGGLTGPDPQALAETMVAETSAAIPPTAPSTDTPTLPPTDTPVPSTPTEIPTPVPSPTEGPFAFQDDFESLGGRWSECEECHVEDGALRMGPWPVSGAYLQHVALCEPCGFARNFRMGVDVTYGDGPSERGFGLVMRLNEDQLQTAEITPWQTTASWIYEFEVENWSLVNGLFTGAVRPGRQRNRIEVEVDDAGIQEKATMTITVNGRSILVLFNQSSNPGRVGLTLFGHAVEAIFDNFEFVELPPYGTRQRDRGPTGNLPGPLF